jgi:hypothetical protein
LVLNAESVVFFPEVHPIELLRLAFIHLIKKLSPDFTSSNLLILVIQPGFFEEQD